MMRDRTRCALWDVNEVCNLKCKFCYHLMYGQPWSGIQMAESMAQDTIATLRTLNVSKIYFVGGEPFLNPALPAMLAAAHANGISTLVTSNGTVLKAYRDDAVMRNVDVVEFSVDSLDPHYLKDVGRLPNTEVISNAIRETTRRGIEVRLITVVTKRNKHELPRLVQFAKDHGVKVAKFQPVYLPRELPLYDELALAATDIEALRTFGRDIYEWTDHLERYFEYLCTCAVSGRRAHMCSAFATYVYVDVHGHIRRCPTLTDSIAAPFYTEAPQPCSEMSLDCLSCYNLIEDFTFALKQT